VSELSPGELLFRLAPLLGMRRAAEFVYGEGDGGDRVCELIGQANVTPTPAGRPVAERTLDIWRAILDCQNRFAVMTVRGVFYQCCSVYGVVEKTDAGYDKVQAQVLKLRRHGVVPWSFIADGTRWVRQQATFDSTEEALQETARMYRRNLWRSQKRRVEVWLEKEALAGLLTVTVYGWGVSLMVSRGQASDSYVYAAAQAAQAAWVEHGDETIVLALYDSDSYGRGSIATIEEKLDNYSDGAPISVRLLAVTDEQILEWQLPTRPGKALDEGRPVVELDAIPPDKLISLVSDAIQGCIVDEHAWRLAREYETSERSILLRIAGAAA
jgi:hypothetical protein